MGQSTALMRPADLPTQAISQVVDLQKTFAALSKTANLVSPVASVGSIAPMCAVSLRMVMIDPQSDCYEGKFCKSGEHALGGVALQKIMAAAGVQILGSHRLDDRSEPHYCAFQVTIGMRDFDGCWRQITKSKEVDLRNGSAEASVMTPNQLSQARAHVQSHAETKALYRALRTLLTLKQKYTKAELAKPFVIPQLVPALDPNDPDQKQALIRMALGTDRQLYGAPKGAEEPRELRDVTPPPPVAPQPQAPPPAKPPVVDATVVRDPDDEDEGPDGDAGSFDVLDMQPEIPTEPVICLCPCSCQREITEQTATLTKERVGAPRCGRCYPGKDFVYEQHKDLKDLQLPKMPGKTAYDVRQAQLKAQANAGARK